MLARDGDARTTDRGGRSSRPSSTVSLLWIAAILVSASHARADDATAGASTAPVTSDQAAPLREPAPPPASIAAETDAATMGQGTADPAMTDRGTPREQTPADATASDATPSDLQTPAPSARARSDHRLSLWLGFSHWFGGTFGSPDGIGTPGLGVGVRPGLSFLEVRARYTVSVTALTLPAGGSSTVGFASLELVATHGLELDRNRIDLYAGPLGAMVHSSGITGAMGFVIGVQWTFVIGTSADVALGVTFEGRQVFYVLPGDPHDILNSPRRDGQMDLGVVLTAL